MAIRLSEAFRPRVSLGVRLVALDGAGGVFLVRHSYVPGLHLPGGAVDAGETCREAAVREAQEEGWLAFDAAPELFNVYRSTAGGRRDHIALFTASGVRQERPKRPGLEIVAAGFHRLDALPDDLTPSTRARIEEIRGLRPKSDHW